MEDGSVRGGCRLRQLRGGAGAEPDKNSAESPGSGEFLSGSGARGWLRRSRRSRVVTFRRRPWPRTFCATRARTSIGTRAKAGRLESSYRGEVAPARDRHSRMKSPTRTRIRVRFGLAFIACPSRVRCRRISVFLPGSTFSPGKKKHAHDFCTRHALRSVGAPHLY